MTNKKENPAGRPGGESTYDRGIHGEQLNTPIVAPLAIIEPEASATGKARIIFYAASIGPNPAYVFTAPVTSYLSIGGFRRMCAEHGVLMTHVGNRVYREVLALIYSGTLLRLGTAEAVEDYLRKAKTICCQNREAV